jgi:hydroxymethylpyrimidine pyrophosphatase-like HAD family hydrolase
VAIGDFNTDIEMLKAADIGACPANAEEEVKQAADIILENTNDQGAVAELINYIINKIE